MSEYLYYEWQTVDRLLTADEQAAVSDLSSHIEVIASKAVVTYNWSDFRHDPTEVLLKYFDAFFYLTNWGSLELVFRFPTGLLDPAEVMRYCDDEMVTFKTTGAHQLLRISINDEGGDEIYDMEANLSDFIQLRADLLEGDYRLLYLAWLLSAASEPAEYDYEYEEEDDAEGEYEDEDEADEDYSNVREPPVPPGLKKLTPALKNFVDVFGVDSFLVEAAAEASPDLRASRAVDYRALVARLPRAECDDFLVRLAEGDSGARVDLRRRLKELQPKETADAHPPAQEARTLQDLLDRAQALEEAEGHRQAEAARLKHIAEMKALAKKEPKVWQQVDTLIETGSKSGSVYDEATNLLEKLKQLSEFQDTRDVFFTRVHGLAEKYASRPSLIRRWQGKGWV